MIVDVKEELNRLRLELSLLQNKIKGIPKLPTVDGEYRLKVASGVVTWVKI